MAYLYGSASSYADLLTALQNACTDNGFTLAGNVLYKGSLYTEVLATSSLLQVQGGTGQTSGALTGRSEYQSSYLGITISVGSGVPTAIPVAFPVDYEIHIHDSPDEVYMVINYNSNCYQYVGFGQSDAQGLPGSGNWYVGSAKANASGSNWGWSQSGYGYEFYWSCAFFDGDVQYGNANGAVNHGFTDYGTPWQNNISYFTRWNLTVNSPSNWNGESVLFPIQVFTRRPSNVYCMVMQMRHARWVMLDNLTDGQVITLGTDKWKVYPLWRRGVRTYVPLINPGNTGTMGWAVRYDGT